MPQDTDMIEPLMMQDGPFDGLELVVADVSPALEIIELHTGDCRHVAFYRRQGDSRTYKYIGEDEA